jgi:uncharacterized membrane protein YkvA (DUF1232 family)
MALNLKQALLQRGVLYFADHPWVMVVAIITYIILPIDLIPEALVGPLGYIDDVVVLMLPLLLREYVRRLRKSES